MTTCNVNALNVEISKCLDFTMFLYQSNGMFGRLLKFKPKMADTWWIP